MAAGNQAAKSTQPTYGNWRKPRTGGVVGQLTLGPSIMLLVGLAVVVVVSMASIWVGLGLALVLGVVVLALSIPDRHGRTTAQRLFAGAAYRRAHKRGTTLYRSGPLGRIPSGNFELPGLAAGSELTEARDAYDRPFALLTYPRTNHHVVVLSCDSDGAALVDQEQVDLWVAHWGQWLAGLAHEPGLVGASVTVEAAPDTGIRLRREVEGQISADAPELAREVLAAVVDTYPAGSAQITTRIALTYSGAARDGRPRRTADEMALDLANRLPGLTSALDMTGAGAARPMTAEQLSEAVRVAYDPSVSVLIEEARTRGGSHLTWDDAGPADADEYQDGYWHDGACSVTWQMSGAPRGEVYSNVLTRFLLPHPDVARKRVTLLYRLHDPASATRVVEADRRNASVRADQTTNGRARESVEKLAADQSAREEATGAGVTRFGLLATATVLDRAQLPMAVAAVENLSGPARIVLRRVRASQASAFAAALPIGLVLPLHLAVPQAVRDAM
ncbi:SCO6880 family protein [Streptomyces sp. NPDC090442]|uniref:SCO6880 family protein n=1 Tax=Streptomyces sp. NPDC090442 TaxID=3365962 RepID=UPI0037FAD6B5